MENLITFNGWGSVNGRWVYLPLYDPTPMSDLGKSLLIIIVITQQLRFIKDPKVREALKKISITNAKLASLGLSSFNPETDGICPPPIELPVKKPIYPIQVLPPNPAFVNTKLTSEFERLSAKANIMQLGIQLKNKALLDAASMI